MFKALSISLFVQLLLVAQADADNWSHWRGPTGNGAAISASPPTQWSNTENVKWSVEIPGRGSGSPVVWEDRVLVVTAVPVAGGVGQSLQRVGQSLQRVGQSQQRVDALQRPAGQRSRGGRSRGAGGGAAGPLEFVVFCFDRDDGELLWKQVATQATPHQGTHPTNGYASASPCTDGAHVYAHFGSRGLFCYTMDGELKWKRDDFGKMNTRSSFGEGSSPTIAGDLIIVPWDHEDSSFLYGINKATGETVWKTPRDEPSCWATPLVVDHQGSKQIIMNGQNCARGYDLETGKELWRCAGQTARPVASAVYADGLAFVGSGFQGSYLGAFRLDGSGDIEQTDKVVWSIDRDTPDIASPLLSDGRLYFHKGKSGLLSCVDAASGKPYYTATRIPGVDSTYASPIAAGGYVYLTDRSGTIVVIEDSPQFKIVATNSLGEGVDATPAPVDDELFIRGAEHLFCIAKPGASR